MPSYQQRSQQIKALSEQQYQQARLKKDESESVRIGDRDGTTGRYQVLRQDGGITNNGIKTFNQAAPQDGFVRMIGSGNSGVALDHRNRKRDERRKKNLEEPTLITPIKFLQNKISTDQSELYIGGDRPDVELIFTPNAGYTVISAKLTTLGTGTDDWMLQVSSLKTTIATAYTDLNGSLYRLYLSDPTIFNQGQLLQTVLPNKVTTISSNGQLLGDGTVYTGQEFNILFAFSELHGSVLEIVGIIEVLDTYDVESTGAWVYTRTNRVVTTTAFDTALDPAGLAIALDTAKTVLEARPSNALAWRTLGNAGLTNPFSGYTVTVPNEFPYVSNFAFDFLELPQLQGLVNDFVMDNGWFFAKNGIYSTVSPKWRGDFVSFNTPSIDSSTVPWAFTEFTSNTQTNSASIPLNATNSASLSLTTASIEFKQSNSNIRNIPTPIPNGGTYKPIDLIQGYNQETQLLKVGSDWRLYDKNGAYTVVAIPTKGGVSFLNDRSRVSLVGDALFLLSGNFNLLQSGTILIAGATLTSSPTDVTTWKSLQCYPPAFDLGQIANISVYITIEEYEALEDYIEP